MAGQEECGRDVDRLSLFFEENSSGSTAELVASVKTRDFENEEKTDNFALQLVNEVGSGLCRTTYKSKHVSKSSRYAIYGAIATGIAIAGWMAYPWQ